MGLKKINSALFKISGILVVVMLLGIVGITFGQVLCRYVLKRSLVWSSEVTVFLLEWMVFLSCSMGYRKDMIASLTIVTDHLPKMGQVTARIIGTLFMMAFMILTFIGNMEVIGYAKGKMSSVLHVNMQFIYSAWSVAAVLMTLYGIEKIYDAVVSAKRKE